MLKNAALRAAAIILAFVSVLTPINALAFDNNYIEKKSAWYQKGEVKKIESGSFSGLLKYIISKSDGCAYFYFSFNDKAIKKLGSDDIALSFMVENSEKSCAFAVNKNGITDDSDENTESFFDVYYNFDNVKATAGAGVILVGFELKNAADRKLLNYISCCFVSSATNVISLAESIELDMYVPTTTKQTTVKTTKSTTAKTTKTTTTKTTTAKTTKQTTVKSTTTKSMTSAANKSTTSSKNKSKTTAKQSTKFAAKTTNRTATTSKATKFAAAADTQNSAEDEVCTTASETESSESSTLFQRVSTTSQTDSTTVKIAADIGRTRAVKSAIVFAIILFIIGLTLIALDQLSKKYKLVKASDKPDKPEPETDENDTEKDDKEHKKADKKK